MSHNPLLLRLISSKLGDYKLKSGTNYAFKCPNCRKYNEKHAHKYKLEVDVVKETYNCWICGGEYNFRGKSIKSLFRKIDASNSDFNELDKFSNNRQIDDKSDKVRIQLPEEYMFLGDYPKKPYLSYLFNERGLTECDIYKYQIGFCTEGEYRNRVIIPSFDRNGIINNFASRAIMETKYPHRKQYNSDENVINFELYTNFSEPVIICEGSFDAISIGDNAIPLFGKNISNKLMERIMEDDVPSIYLCLDKDAIKYSIKIAEKMLNLGKKVHLVELNGKDPNKIGHEKVRELINSTPILNESEIIRLKFKN
jgi:transcription elongation factor Elf1